MNNQRPYPTALGQQKERVSERSCPRCRFRLVTIRIEHAVDVDRCHHCRGSFLDPGEETALLGPLASPSIWRDSKLVTQLGTSSLKSPVSGKLMTRYRLDFGKAVVIDKCEESGGLWLDAGEGDTLRRILEKAAQAKDSPLEKQRPALHAGTYLFQVFSGAPLEVWNPRSRFPWMTLGIITACIVVFALQLVDAHSATQNSIIDTFALSPRLFQGESLWGVITYMFLHGSTGHLFGNLLYLYIFGDNVEDKLGRREFLQLYILAGIAGGIVQVLLAGPESLSVVGASGAIAGVIAAYWVLFPFVRLRMVFFFIPLYFGIGVYTAGWLLINLDMSMMSTNASHTAWFCHLGGFAAGILLAWPHRQKSYAEILGERFRKH